MSHYQSQKERRILEPKELLKVTPFRDYEDFGTHEGNDLSTHKENETILRAREEAAKIINQAMMEATTLKENALLEIGEWKRKELQSIDEESNRLYSKSKEEGYQEGYQFGLSEGTKEAHNLYNDYIDHASSIIKQAEVDRRKRIEQTEPFLVELSVEIARKIIRHELNFDQQLLLQMVKETLKLSSELKEVTLAVHPDDYDLIRSRMDELKSLISSQANLILLPDHSVTSGGCMVRTSLGTLDARVDTQLEEIKVVLLDAIKGSEIDELEPFKEI